MTKMLQVRVQVPCDDVVTTSMLAEAVQGALEGLPIVRIPIEGSEGGRVHWSAVSVKRGADPEERKPAPIHVRGRRVATAGET